MINARSLEILQEILAEKNCSLMGLFLNNGKWQIIIHNRNLVDREPVEAEMRDRRDYELAMKSWYKRGRRLLAQDTNIDKAMELAVTKAAVITRSNLQ